MNAVHRMIAARPINVIFFPVAHQGTWVVALVIALLVSALGIIYAKDLNRRVFIEKQNINQRIIIETEQSNELLLEKGTLLAQPRIEHIAQKEFGMAVPQRQDVQFVSMHSVG